MLTKYWENKGQSWGKNYPFSLLYELPYKQNSSFELFICTEIYPTKVQTKLCPYFSFFRIIFFN